MTLETPVLPRRAFLGTGAGLTLGLFLPAGRADAANHRMATAGTSAVNSWLTIGTDNSVTLTIGSSDMGQGSFAGLAQILCEDLMVSPTAVQLVQGGPTTASPAPLGTSINTVGSSVTRNNFWNLRHAGATAREMLVSAAMASIGDTNRNNYTVSNGVILNVPSGATRTYGQVAAAAALLPPPSNAPLVPDSQFTCIGKTFPRPDIPLKVNGSAVYGLDVRLPNMVYAAIRHCPNMGGVLASTPKVPAGMIAVVPTKVINTTQRGIEATGNVNAVAVVGTNTWDAWQAVDALALKWTLPANAASLNNAQFLSDAQALLNSATPYVAGAANGPGTLYTVEQTTADPNTAINNSAKIVDATYTLPYVSHACMEVLNCTVNYVPGVQCEIWAPTQSAASILSLVSSITGLTTDKIIVHVTYLGGGLGRKAENDFISQAVQVAVAVQRPVKLMWPREQDFTHDQYRPLAMVHSRAGLDVNSFITGWTYRNVSPSILVQRGVVLGPTGDSQGYEGSNALPYNFGARLTEYVTHPSPIPVGFWRSVGASINTFAVESMIDELAAAAGQDPYQFRRARLTDPRWIGVLDAAANAAGWSTPPARNTARGIAVGTAFNTVVAQVVEIAKSGTSFKVTKSSVAVDCYLPVSPGSIEAQIIGGVVHAMNAAMYGRQNFSNGAAQYKNFNNSRVIRISEMPSVQVVLMPPPVASDPTVAIGGIGELGVPTFAPALANAYAKLFGQRVRTLPFFPNATMSDG